MKNRRDGGAVEYPGLRFQLGCGARQSQLRQSVQQFLRKQFGRPAGIWGNIVGRIMAHTPSNRERTDWTVSLLDVQPEDRVLEIGFGPGMAIERVSGIAQKGFILGVDHSEVMVKQASRLNAKGIAEQRVMLALGSPRELPAVDKLFDKIFTINSIHFWNEPVECLRELRTRLRPGGLMAVTIQPRSRGATLETTRLLGAELAEKLEGAGFAETWCEVNDKLGTPAVCVLGVR